VLTARLPHVVPMPRLGRPLAALRGPEAYGLPLVGLAAAGAASPLAAPRPVAAAVVAAFALGLARRIRRADEPAAAVGVTLGGALVAAGWVAATGAGLGPATTILLLAAARGAGRSWLLPRPWTAATVAGAAVATYATALDAAAGTVPLVLELWLLATTIALAHRSLRARRFLR
jgi:hypothetical protein